MNIEEDEYAAIIIYPSEISEYLPSENQIQELALQHCTSHHAKLKGDLEQLNILVESRQILHIVLHSLEHIYIYIGSMTDSFIDLMRRDMQVLMGHPNKWPKIEK